MHFFLPCDKMNYILTCLANSFFFVIDNINIILLCYQDSHIVSEVVFEKKRPYQKIESSMWYTFPRFYAKKRIFLQLQRFNLKV